MSIKGAAVGTDLPHGGRRTGRCVALGRDPCAIRWDAIDQAGVSCSRALSCQGRLKCDPLAPVEK